MRKDFVLGVTCFCALVLGCLWLAGCANKTDSSHESSREKSSSTKRADEPQIAWNLSEANSSPKSSPQAKSETAVEPDPFAHTRRASGFSGSSGSDSSDSQGANDSTKAASSAPASESATAEKEKQSRERASARPETSPFAPPSHAVLSSTAKKGDVPSPAAPPVLAGTANVSPNAPRDATVQPSASPTESNTEPAAAQSSKTDSAKPENTKPELSPASSVAKAEPPGAEMAAPDRRDSDFRPAGRPPLVPGRETAPIAQDTASSNTGERSAPDTRSRTMDGATLKSTANAGRDSVAQVAEAEAAKAAARDRQMEAAKKVESSARIAPPGLDRVPMESPTASELGGAALAPSQWRAEWSNVPGGPKAPWDRSPAAEGTKKSAAEAREPADESRPPSSAAIPPAGASGGGNSAPPSTPGSASESLSGAASSKRASIRPPSAPSGYSLREETEQTETAVRRVAPLLAPSPAAMGHSLDPELPDAATGRVLSPRLSSPAIKTPSPDQTPERIAPRSGISNGSPAASPPRPGSAAPAAPGVSVPLVAPTIVSPEMAGKGAGAPLVAPMIVSPEVAGKGTGAPLVAPMIVAPEAPGRAMAVSDDPPTEEAKSARKLESAAQSDKPLLESRPPAIPAKAVPAPKVTPPAADSALPLDDNRSPTAATAAPNDENSDSRMVKVFYGTDRLALSPATSRDWGYTDWAYLSAMASAVTLVLGAISYCHPRNRLLLGMTSITVLGTGMLVFATIRAGQPAQSSEVATSRVYGNDRGELELGVCQVTIPKEHKTGEMERPSIFRLQLREDPRRHIMLLTVEQQTEDAFFSAMKARIDDSTKKEAMVFIHGFNVTFEEAAMRTAQLAYDLKIDGAPVFFSWPSQGGLLRYAVDETNVAWSVPHLKDFLVSVARRSGAQSVNVIAHSMGNRALAAALQILSYELQEETPLFQQVVLTAPDIDADVFKRDIAPRIVKTANRVTLYASSNDEALKLSKELHGYPRAGDSGPELLVIPGIDTIDVTMVDTSLLGHSYYGSNNTVLQDLFDLLSNSKPPDQRTWLRAVPMGTMNYWVFTAARAGLNASRKAEGLLRK